MTIMTKILAGGTAIAALGAAAPAAAQYYANPYSYNAYGNARYGAASPYGYNAYGGYGANTSLATQQCTAAVQNRLYNRTTLAGILGAVLGTNTATGRVVAITQVAPRNNGTLRVRGLASSGRYAYNSYGPYGVGAYGALGYNTAAAADLSFRCDVDYRGYVRSVDINRR